MDCAKHDKTSDVKHKRTVLQLCAFRTNPLNIFVSLSHELLGAVDHRELLRRELTEPINRHAGAEQEWAGSGFHSLCA